jgi:hypothetical protein
MEFVCCLFVFLQWNYAEGRDISRHRPIFQLLTEVITIEINLIYLKHDLLVFHMKHMYAQFNISP